ncbi:hypothetical protein [Achromobacter ruhlandii]|uniref:hypothetical protein n=1 Tax=Achromobacter ruhlandii TaxID=72557 RepID=UPI0007BEE431|nr:hypothetical protein [Achromobacter ruhlandii]
MSIPVSIHTGGSNNEDPISRVPGVEEHVDGFEGFVALTAHRPDAVRTRSVYTGEVRATEAEAMEDAKQLAISIDPDQYV